MHLVNLINTCQNGKLDCTCMHVPFPKIEKKDKKTANTGLPVLTPMALLHNQVHVQLTNKKYFKYRTNVICP